MNSCASSSRTLSPTSLVRLFAATRALLVIICLTSISAFAQCNLNGNNVPCVLTGPLTITSYNDGTGNTTTASGALTDNGTMSILGYIELVGATSLSGPGTLTLTNGQIGTNSNSYTLTNASTINGSGVIGSNAGPVYQNLSLSNSGTIDANSSGNTLSIQGTGGSIVNTGMFEATNSGILNLATTAAINNAGGTIAATGTNSVVNMSTTIQGGTLKTSGGGVMQTTGTATLDATTQGAITLSDGSTYTAGASGSGTITAIQGTLNLGTVSGSSMALGGALELINNTTVNTPGSGAITMNNGQIGTNSTNYTLTNDGLIRGSGIIGSNNTTYGNLSLNNIGTISANAVGKTLSIQGTGGSNVNAGTLKAVLGGILNLATPAAINNIGGTITAIGTNSVVNVSTTIEGGTLSTSTGGVMQTTGTATLDGTSQGTITLSDGSIYTAGPAGSGIITNVTGTLNLGTVSGSTMALGGALQLVNDTTVVTPGTGSITMSNGQIGTNSHPYTLTNNGLIQGSGVIGSNNTTYGNLSLNNTGTINANSSGNTLSIQGTGSSVINAGLLEATNGGILNLATTVAINNSGKNITATGAGSTVNISTTIQGGNLNSSGGGVLQTSGTATLDAASAGPITLSDHSTYLMGAGTLTNVTGQLNIHSGTSSTVQVSSVGTNYGYFRLVGNTTLSGTGSVLLNGGLLGTDGNSYTLANASTILGYGVIGSNIGSDFQSLSLNNTGTINANSSGNTLSIQGTGTSIVNAALLEATSGGTLNLSTQAVINNSGGNITATGTGSTVDVSSTIQGGTLNTSGGGIMQTVAPNGNGNGTKLDGITNGAITISDGSTFTSAAGLQTDITGALKLGTVTGGTLALSTDLRLVGNTTLSGPGSMTLSGSAQIGTDGNAFTLTNNSTIKGTGLIGSNIGVLFGVNNVTNGGTILSSGGTLTMGGTGTLTNTGTLHASAGTTLISSMTGLSSSTFSGTTLLTGTYVADAGATLQINALGNTGGEIVTNDGHISLNGTASSFVDSAGKDVLTSFNTNGTGSGFTITGGRNFTTAGNFTNNGTLTVGSGSTFDVNGNLTNFSGTTLTGGTYSISGTFQFNGANIVNNSAKITLNGTSSKIIAKNGTSALANFAKNTSLGTFAVTGGRSFTTLSNFTNNGILTVGSGSKFDVNGSLTNFSGTTLTGGTYNVTGTLQFNSANIVTNAATITLTGAASKIVDQTGITNGLANFATNATAGSFTLASGRNLTTAGAFSNAGTLKVSTGTTFTVAPGNSFTQSAGKTTDDGTMAVTGAGAFTFSGGSIFGNAGTFLGNLTSSSTFNIGDAVSLAGKMAVTGNYVQTSTGILNADIGGATAGSKYDQLNVTGTVTLGGTLNLSLINSFVPTIGSTYDIMNFASETGSFTTINGTHINPTEHFAVVVNPTNVTLDVLAGPAPAWGLSLADAGASGGPNATPEPSSLLLLGSGLAGLAAYSRRSKRA